MSTTAPPAQPVVWKVWNAGLAPRFFWRDWGADSVVYDALTGQTHQFTPLAAACFACLEENPASVAALAAALAADVGSEPTNELESNLAQLVLKFRELEWIEPLAAAA